MSLFVTMKTVTSRCMFIIT